MRTSYSYLFLFLLFYSCTNERQDLNQNFEELYQNYQLGNFDKVLEQLDENSLAYFNDINAAENLNIDKVVQIAQKYNLTYHPILYLAQWGTYMQTAKNKTDYFNYLNDNSVSFFSKQEAYKVVPEKTRIGKESFVAIFREEYGQNKLSWIKFIKDKNGNQKLDLLFTLRNYEKQYKEIYKNMRSENKNLSDAEFYKYLYGSLGKGSGPNKDQE